MPADSSSRAVDRDFRIQQARIVARLEALERARRTYRVQSTASRELLYLLLACGAVLFISRWVHDIRFPRLTLLVAAVGSAAMVARAWGKTRTVNQIAMWIDARAGLDERVASALAFVDDRERSEMMQTAITDAADKLQRVSEGDVLDGKPPRRWPAFLLFLLLLPLLAMLPPVMTVGQQQAQRTSEEIHEIGEGLAEEGEELVNQLGSTPSPQATEAVEEVQDAAEELSNDEDITREEAVERLQEAQEEVEQTLDEDAANRRMAEQLQQSAPTRQAGEALAEGDTQQAAEELRNAAESLSQEDLQGEAGQQLADQLRAAGQEAASPEAEAAANEAAAAAEAGRLEETQQALEELAQAIENTQSLSDEERSAVEQAAGALQEAIEAAGTAGTPTEEQSPTGEQQPGGEQPQPSETQGVEEGPSGGAPPEGATGESTEEGQGGEGNPTEGSEGEGGSGSTDGGATAELSEAELNDPELLVTVASDILDRGEETDERQSGGRIIDDEDNAVDSGAVVRAAGKAGEADLARQDIPPAYRSLVREYYNSLEETADEPDNAEAQP